MSPLKINKKSVIRESFARLLNYIFAYEWDKAELELDSLEDALTQHLLVRNGYSSNIRESFRVIRMYLREKYDSQDKKRILLEKITELINSINFKNMNASNGNAFTLLKSLYEEMKDDWTEFWRNPKPGAIDSLIEDLDALDRLEEAFRKESPDVYKQYRVILSSRGSCYSLFPILSLVPKQPTMKEEYKRRIYESFSKLFYEIEKLMAPSGFEFKEEATPRRRSSVISVGDIE